MVPAGRAGLGRPVLRSGPGSVWGALPDMHPRPPPPHSKQDASQTETRTASRAQRTMLLSLCVTPAVGKEHSRGRRGGACGDLEKNLRSGSDRRCLDGGIRKPEPGFALGELFAFCPRDGRAGVEEEEPEEVMAPSLSFS